MKLTNEQLLQAVKQTIETYNEVRTNPELIELYKDSPKSITIENVAENELDNNMNYIDYDQEDEEEVIKQSKQYIECPKCKTRHKRLLALSRRDNETMICDNCGTKEAIEDEIKFFK